MSFGGSTQQKRTCTPTCIHVDEQIKYKCISAPNHREKIARVGVPYMYTYMYMLDGIKIHVHVHVYIHTDDKAQSPMDSFHHCNVIL